MRSVLRDPFARGNVVRETVMLTTDAHGCKWCGLVRRTRTNKPFLYRYGWQADDKGHPAMQDKLFCSRSCERAYNA